MVFNPLAGSLTARLFSAGACSGLAGSGLLESVEFRFCRDVVVEGVCPSGRLSFLLYWNSSNYKFFKISGGLSIPLRRTLSRYALRAQPSLVGGWSLRIFGRSIISGLGWFAQMVRTSSGPLSGHCSLDEIVGCWFSCSHRWCQLFIHETRLVS